MAITKDFVADYGADNTGVASVTTKLYTDLKADMQGQDVNLTFPAGSYNIATFGGSGGSWINGALDLNVTATGATLFGSGGVFLSTAHIGQIGIDATSQTPTGFTTAGGKSARIQSCSPGATSVTLTTSGLPGGGGSAGAGHVSRFVVGNWMMVCGWAIQGSFQSGYSFPPNFQWSEFVKITSIVGDTIYFTGHPLINAYSQDWPEVNRGSEFECEAAGPATIFAMSPHWGGNTTFNGGTYDNSNLINCYRENFTMNGGTSSGLPIYPSVNKSFRAINHTATTALVELDKISDTVEFTGGTYSSLKSQSPGARITTISNLTTGSFNGTNKNTIIDSCTVTPGGLRMGPQSYGVGEKLVVRNTSVAGTINGDLEDNGPGNQGWTCLRMSGGIITVPLCYASTFGRVVAPDSAGRNVSFWATNGGAIGTFKALSVTSDSWPASDIKSATTNVTTTSSSKTITVSSNLFVSGDVNKVIILPGAAGGGNTLRTIITAVGTWNGSSQDITVFEPAGVTAGPTSRSIDWGTANVYVQTEQAGGLPSSGLYSGDLRIIRPPARWLYFSDCTGSDDILDLCNAGAQGKPWKSYTKRAYGSTQIGGAIAPLGNLVSIKVNVTKAYTGVASFLNAQLNQFNNASVVLGGALGTVGYAVNLKITGERVFTIGGTTGAQAGDTLYENGSPLGSPVFNSSIFFRGASFSTRMSSDISAESSSLWPEFTVEIITDQGVPAEATNQSARVRIRIR